MKLGPLAVAAAALAGVISAAPRAARAQTFAPEAALVEGRGRRYKSAQLFAVELRFGPYMPDVDGEFNGARNPYVQYFGKDERLLMQVEVDYEFFHRVGTLALGLGLGYFNATATAPYGNGTGLASPDQSTFKIVPVSLSLVYRFDYFLETRGFPLVPFAKVGFDYAYWQITDGNGEIAEDGFGGEARGGTPGWHGAMGVALALDMFDPSSARDFDNDLGVNHTSIVFQYTHADISGLGMSKRMHVGDTNWSLGLMFQF